MASSPRITASTGSDWVLRTPADARRALMRPGVMLTGTRQLSFADGSVSFPRRELKAGRLRFWQSVCGCQAAGLTFLCWTLFAAWSAWPVTRFDGWALAATFGQALLAAIAAKVFVMGSARALLALELLWLGSLAEGPLLERVERP